MPKVLEVQFACDKFLLDGTWKSSESDYEIALAIYFDCFATSFKEQ